VVLKHDSAVAILM